MHSSENKYLVTNCSIILLAAGASKRLGRPKQFLNYNNKTLLQHSIDTAKNTWVQNIVLVLGADLDLMIQKTETANILIAKNENWNTGIASSVCCGINALKNIVPAIDAAIFMVCDQPFVTAALLNNLISTQKQTNKPIVACSYENTLGIPVLFHKIYFPELLALKGHSGAKKIILQNEGAVAVVPFLLGSIDIDTKEDCAMLKNKIELPQ